MMSNLVPIEMAKRPTGISASAARIRHQAIAFALSVGCLAMASGYALAAVFGRDDRKPVAGTTSQPGSAGVGRLSSAASGRFCTAFCVADDIIATAGHCLVGTDAGDAPNLDELEFSLAPETGTSDAAPAETGLAGRSTGTVSLNIISGLRQLRTRAPMNADRDWAVAKLETPVCQGRTLGLAPSEQPASPTTSSGNVRDIAPAALPAWHADTQNSVLHLQTGCTPLASITPATRRAMMRDFTSRNDLRLHGCDTGPGASGAPLLTNINGRSFVAAINTGTYTLVGTEPSDAGPDSAPAHMAIANTAVSVAPLRAAIVELSRRTVRMQTGPQSNSAN